MMGCSSAKQYYTEASCEPLLHRVRVPMLFLSARNDPIAPGGLVDTAAFTSAPAAPLLLCRTREGGHSMTWPEGCRGTGRAWSADVLVEFVRAVAAS